MLLGQVERRERDGYHGERISRDIPGGFPVRIGIGGAWDHEITSKKGKLTR